MNDPSVVLVTPRFRVVRKSLTTRAGHVHTREIIESPSAVVILPMVDDDHVCLIRNRRVAVDETLLELPAGTCEPHEPIVETARRELREETGYEAGYLEELHAFWMSPGILNERMYLYLARELSPGPSQPEPYEDLENVVLPWDEALRAVHNRIVQDAKSLVGLLLYDRLRPASNSDASMRCV